MLSEGEVCPRCGLECWIHPDKCRVRPEPYKTKDGADCHIGMRLWVYFDWTYDQPILTGIVQFILNGGSVMLRRDRPDRDGYTHGAFNIRRCCFASAVAAEACKNKGK